jgi:hypothetical protein
VPTYQPENYGEVPTYQPENNGEILTYQPENKGEVPTYQPENNREIPKKFVRKIRNPLYRGFTVIPEFTSNAKEMRDEREAEWSSRVRTATQPRTQLS